MKERAKEEKKKRKEEECLAIADDEQAQARKILCLQSTQEHKGGGQLQQCELLCDGPGLKCSAAVLVVMHATTAMIYCMFQGMRATVECEISCNFLLDLATYVLKNMTNTGSVGLA